MHQCGIFVNVRNRVCDPTEQSSVGRVNDVGGMRVIIDELPHFPRFRGRINFEKSYTDEVQRARRSLRRRRAHGSDNKVRLSLAGNPDRDEPKGPATQPPTGVLLGFVSHIVTVRFILIFSSTARLRNHFLLSRRGGGTLSFRAMSPSAEY